MNDGPFGTVEKASRNYHFLSTIGEGSFGKVMLATNSTTGEKVAVKIVDKRGITDVEDVERVYRETFILTTLKHKNIIKLHEVFDTPDSIMLVMEYADGGELLSFVSSRKRLGEHETCMMFHQIVSGVEYCHRAKIIHRDLKLENILLDKHGNIKIADFGLSNTIKFGQKMDTNCGTPSYTPPEQLSGEKCAGAPADLWSMGVILFAMVCGFLPFEADAIPALFRKIRHRQYVTPDFISTQARDLIERMFVLDPDQRCTLAELRNMPWFLMEYTDLVDSIDQEIVTPDQIMRSRQICRDCGQNEDEAKDKEREKDRQQKSIRASPSHHNHHNHHNNHNNHDFNDPKRRSRKLPSATQRRPLQRPLTKAITQRSSITRSRASPTPSIFERAASNVGAYHDTNSRRRRTRTSKASFTPGEPPVKFPPAYRTNRPRPQTSPRGDRFTPPNAREIRERDRSRDIL